MRQAQKAAECSNQDQNKKCNTSNIPSIPSIGLSQSNTSRIDQPICTKNKPSSNELTRLVQNHRTGQPINLSHYGNPSHREETVGAAVGHQLLGGNSGVSLTLGLHQTNVARLSEPHPLSVPQFGLAGLGGSNANISYGQFGGFNSQIRHFDTQLLHDWFCWTMITSSTMPSFAIFSLAPSRSALISNANLVLVLVMSYLLVLEGKGTWRGKYILFARSSTVIVRWLYVILMGIKRWVGVSNDHLCIQGTESHLWEHSLGFVVGKREQRKAWQGLKKSEGWASDPYHGI